MINKLHINTLVNISFFTVIILFTILMIASNRQLAKIESDSHRITSLRVPTAKASASINTAINTSLAALRGWMLIKEERFIIARRDAWQTIRQDQKQLVKLSKKWTNLENIERLSIVTALLDQLETEQLNIELLTHKAENIRSSEILLTSAAPIAASITNNITKMIDFNKSQESSAKRIQILITMADFRGSFAISLADIRAFLLSAEPRFKSSFESHWSKNTTSYDKLNELAQYLTPFEQSLLNEIKALRKKFSPLPKKMFDSRLGKDWNRSSHLLNTTAVKTSNKLVVILQKMADNQNILLKKDAQLLSDDAAYLEIFQMIFLGFIVSITLYFSIIINKKYRVFRHNLNNRNSLVDQNVLMATLDNNGAIINISNALCRLLGGVKEDFIGQESYFFLPEDDHDELQDKILKSLKTGKTWQGNFKRNNLDGEEIWLCSTIFPINNEGEGESKSEDEGEGWGYYNILENITDRMRFEEVSVTDKLTSLYNRRKFDEIIDLQIKLARRRKTHLTMAIIDVDFFKKYNDHYGHPAGDTALTRTAAALRSNLSRPDDYVFRLGGEEFGLIFNSLNKEQSKDILERICKSVEQLKIEHKQNEVSDYLTISIGSKICPPNELMEKDALYNEADRLLYIAKQTRNTVCIN
ncbi:MAG: GGDEF domain-containing protein [Gammaproteobacteria bacterium]|nr:GGDEF domain-containing protein [Gammaproteobacteria bacterium]